MTMMVPQKLLHARTASFGIGHLLTYMDFDRKEEYDKDAVWLFDTILPPFQRELEWTEAMMVRFIESAWRGVDLGRYVVNDAMDAPMRKGARDGCQWHPTDRWLIDGQQRLTAILCYVTDQFAVKGEDGLLHLWSDLPKADQRHFGSCPFDRGITRIYDEHNLRVLYDQMNFGGVRHKESQRALRSDEIQTWR